MSSQEPVRVDGIQFRSLDDKMRFKRWLGKLQKRRAQLRVHNPVPCNKHYLSLCNRFVQAAFPWNIEQYPGKTAMLAWVIGTSWQTAAQYMAGQGLPQPGAGRAAKWCRAKAAELVALAEELERVPETKRGFRKRQK